MAHVGVAAALLWASCHRATLQFDPDFDTAVAAPAYRHGFPRVLFDEAHRNYHTAAGRYRPFVELLNSDGYRFVRNGAPFTDAVLGAFDLLVIANARGPDPGQDESAFTEAECDTLRDWVGAGGALLLIADHHPFAGAAARLAGRFGVGITRGITEDPVHSGGSPAFLLFTRENGLLLDHPITEGRGPNERVSRVMSFGGASLQAPAAAVPLLKLSPQARERPGLSASARARPERSPLVRYGEAGPAQGSVQALALVYGRGRVVILAEAGMLTAQLRGASEPFGMNVAGIDNRQLALNIMRWLSRLLAP